MLFQPCEPIIKPPVSPSMDAYIFVNYIHVLFCVVVALFGIVVVVQLLSRVQLFVTPWTVACQASLFFTISWSLHRTHVR